MCKLDPVLVSEVLQLTDSYLAVMLIQMWPFFQHKTVMNV
jgi:hypothetical protein